MDGREVKQMAQNTREMTGEAGRMAGEASSAVGEAGRAIGEVSSAAVGHVAEGAGRVAGEAGRIAMGAAESVGYATRGESGRAVEGAERATMRGVGSAIMGVASSGVVERAMTGSAAMEREEVGGGGGLANAGRGSLMRQEYEAVQAWGENGLVGGEREQVEQVQGRNASEMMGVAGRNLRQLEHPSERMRMRNEQVREQAELESGYARNEIDPNLSSVGLTSEVERAEYRAADLANAEGEIKPEGFEDKLQNKTQEEIGRATEVEMRDRMRQKSFSPNEIEKLRFNGMRSIMKSFKRPRIFGERNG